jgi:hypothetical protein
MGAAGAVDAHEDSLAAGVPPGQLCQRVTDHRLVVGDGDFNTVLSPAVTATNGQGSTQGRVKVGNVRSDLGRWGTLAAVRRPSLPYGSLPARSAPAFRPGQSDLAVRCAGQHGHADSSPQLTLAASTQLRRLHDDFDAALDGNRPTTAEDNISPRQRPPSS